MELKSTAEAIERAVLVGIELDKNSSGYTLDESLAELAELATTAGAEVVATVTQHRDRPDKAFFVGSGKVAEITDALTVEAGTLVIFDDELSPSQQTNLENALGVKVIDRTALILDIFAQRARSREGKLQVELAQLKYNLPRLMGRGLTMSRLGGGIGTRGPGESKLEMDRRRIYERVHDIEQQIKELCQQRALQRRSRERSRIPQVALVGYTNAGKSTLLNVLTGAEVLAEDKLFATLDTTTRRLELTDEQEIVLTDTVGFIQKLPHSLVAAFRATLEEVTEADLLLHVVDCTNANAEEQIVAVTDVLRELKADTKPTIFVFNKADMVDNKNQLLATAHAREAVFISAKTGENLSGLREKIAGFFRESRVSATLLVPYGEGAVLTALHELKAVREVEYIEAGTQVTAELALSDYEKYKRYEIQEDL